MSIDCAIIGSGNIGTDLMVKLLRKGGDLRLAALVGVDPASEGLRRARDLKVATTHEGLAGLLRLPGFRDIRIIFDATSAKSHVAHNRALRDHDVTLVDLTPAAVGPYCVPVVNLDALKASRNVNMVTCGGQATIPIVHAVSRVARVHYAEIVASIASRSAGPGTRSNIDEFTETTAHAIQSIGGAERGKAIIVLNPAEPPMLMRDTVFTLSDGADESAIAESIERVTVAVNRYVPGYRLKQQVQFDRVSESDRLNIPGLGRRSGLKTTVFLEVEGAADYLPSYAGNLDIMTSAALAVGERLAQYRMSSLEAKVVAP